MASGVPACPAQSTVCDDELGTVTLPCLLPPGHEADGTWHDFGEAETNG